MSIARDVAELIFGTDIGDFGARRRVWAARRANATTTEGAVVGQWAKVAGIARAVETTLLAPFTRRPALAYRARVLEKFVGTSPQGREEVSWKPAINEASALPFVIEDDAGGRILVSPQSGIVVLDDAEVNEHPFVNDDNPDFRAYLRRRGVLSTMYMGIAGDHLFFEAVVSPGDRIAVWGAIGETSGVAGAGYRDVATRAKTIAGTPADPCVILRDR